MLRQSEESLDVLLGIRLPVLQFEGWFIYQAMTEYVIVVFASFDDNELVFVVDNVVLQSTNDVIMKAVIAAVITSVDFCLTKFLQSLSVTRFIKI